MFVSHNPPPVDAEALLAKVRATGATSQTTVSVLGNLYGAPLDEIAMGYVHGLNPTRIRCVAAQGGALTSDSIRDRITIYYDDKNRITDIEMEITVALPKGIEHAHDLNMALMKGMQR
jgi:hypothetical protein